MCGFRIPVRIPVRSVLVTMNGDQLRSGLTLTVATNEASASSLALTRC